jgi:hypothetical protein
MIFSWLEGGKGRAALFADAKREYLPVMLQRQCSRVYISFGGEMQTYRRLWYVWQGPFVRSVKKVMDKAKYLRQA